MLAWCAIPPSPRAVLNASHTSSARSPSLLCEVPNQSVEHDLEPGFPVVSCIDHSADCSSKQGSFEVHIESLRQPAVSDTISIALSSNQAGHLFVSTGVTSHAPSEFMGQMHPAALIEGLGGQSKSPMPVRPLSPVENANHLSRSHETSKSISRVKRISRIHLGTGIRVTKDIVQTVHVLPESSKFGSSSAKHCSVPGKHKHKHLPESPSKRMKTSSHPSGRTPEEHPSSSSVVHNHRPTYTVTKQRPQSALLLSPSPPFQESPEFATHYNADQVLVAKRPSQRRRSTSEERVTKSNKPEPRDAHAQRGNARELILFFQGKRMSIGAESIVPQDKLLCGPGGANPITSIKAASHKFSQFVHPKPVTVLSVTSPTSQDVAKGQNKTKVTTKLYQTKRKNGKPKRPPIEIEETMTGPDIINVDGNFEGLVDLNAAEKSALKNGDTTSLGTAQDESSEEKWERWNRYIGQFGSAEKFAEQVNAAMSGGLDGTVSNSGNLKPTVIPVPVSKHDVPETSLPSPSSNLQKDSVDAHDFHNTDTSLLGLNSFPHSKNGQVVLTASRAPRRKGVAVSQPIGESPSVNHPKEDLEQPGSPVTSSNRPESRSSDYYYNKSSNGDAKSSSIGSNSLTGPATHSIPPPPRTSSRPSSRSANHSVCQFDSSSAGHDDQVTSPHQLGYQSSNEALRSRRTRRRDSLLIPNGPSASTSTLSVIESQTIPYTPPQSPKISIWSNFDSTPATGRAPTPIHYQPKTKAPTEPPMGPLPELPEGADRSSAPSRESYRSKRSSRQTQASSHGRNNTSLTSISSSGARSPPPGFNYQNSPEQPSSLRSSSGPQQAESRIKMDTSVFNPVSVGRSRDLRSPVSVKSQDSEASTAATRADRVRMRKLRDTASIRARLENRALEEREATSKAASSPAVNGSSVQGESPHLDRFPSIPLSLPNSTQGRNTPPPGPNHHLVRRRSSFLRSNSFTIRQTLSRSPIFIVAESDPLTSKFRTACRSDSSTPTSPSITSISTLLSNNSISNHHGQHAQLAFPVRSKKSERSMHSLSKTSITRNGAQTPPHSESSLQSSDEEGPNPRPHHHPPSKPPSATTTKQTKPRSPKHPAPNATTTNKSITTAAAGPSSPIAKALAASQASREDVLEQRIQRLEEQNRKYLAMINAWLNPSEVLQRESSIRSSATRETASTHGGNDAASESSSAVAATSGAGGMATREDAAERDSGVSEKVLSQHLDFFQHGQEGSHSHSRSHTHPSPAVARNTRNRAS